ncbi:thiopeptide-type bacteriocin biosynthesis protein [Nannocystis pusilla]|uniref:thiopeptide-type bacteriocin biosynthesis protein n=1 Tax=Nannocystis pusilla TaxID=889268 RepID=UPI003BF31947
MAARDGSWRAAERGLMRRLDAALPALRAAGADSLWFVRKPPGLRIRCGGPLRPELPPVLEDILLKSSHDDGDVVEWFYSAYEPETYDLGGPGATAAAHRYFDADTRLYLARERLVASGAVSLGAAAQCLAVLADLFVRCTGDHGEAWDVWCNLEKLYSGVEAPALTLAPVSLAGLRRRTDTAEAHLLDGHEAANRAYAAELDDLWRRGELLWGRRAILPAVAAFVWNRHAVPAATIAACVRAMVVACNPKRGLVGLAPDPVR